MLSYQGSPFSRLSTYLKGDPGLPRFRYPSIWEYEDRLAIGERWVLPSGLLLLVLNYRGCPLVGRIRVMIRFTRRR